MNINTKYISRISILILVLATIYFASGAVNQVWAQNITPDSTEFKNYWNAGKAEIASYKLEQARYGELHSGYSVLVFVTEDFSKDKQVKLDNPSGASQDKVRILKLNRVKKFNTGIYRYSMMDSVFTPIDLEKFPNTLKLTSSSQEWCGQTYTQVNLRDSEFRVESFSYFESEGDRAFNLQDAFLEDELWNRIRINPDSLPTGQIRIIPGAMASRLTHRELSVETANASLRRNSTDPSALIDYSITYPDSNRSLTVTFNKEFPHQIISWEETYKSGFGPSARSLTTKATLDKTLMSDYWNKNTPMDEVLRKELGL